MPYRSPFEPTLLKRGAVLGQLGDVSVALHFGDPAAEIQALHRGAALIDLPWRGVIEMTGRDRVRFLHGMCTNDIKKLDLLQGCMAAIVNRQGKMVAEMIVRATENALLLELDRSNLQGAIDALSNFLVADDVKMKIADIDVLGVYGPNSKDILSNTELPAFHSGRRGGTLLSRSPFLGVDGYEILVESSATGEALLIFGRDLSMAGFEAFEALRIENGFPRWRADMGPDVLPMEAGLEPIAISYTKGCYIGQEVIQRVKTYSEPPKALVQLALDNATVPALAARIHAEAHHAGHEVGHVTSAALSPKSGRGIALGYVRKEFKAPGIRVTIAPGTPATVQALPWQERLSVS